MCRPTPLLGHSELKFKMVAIVYFAYNVDILLLMVNQPIVGAVVICPSCICLPFPHLLVTVSHSTRLISNGSSMQLALPLTWLIDKGTESATDPYSLIMVQGIRYPFNKMKSRNVQQPRKATYLITITCPCS